MEIQNDPVKGISWYVFHCLMFSLIEVSTKFILEDYHVFQILFIQTSVGALFLLPIILKNFRKEVIESSYRWHVLRSLFWVLASAMYFYALTKIQLPKAVAIAFSTPLFTTLLAIFFLKEKLHLPRALAMIAGISGMFIIVQPGNVEFEMAALWVIGAAFLWSFTDIMIKVMGKTQNAVLSTFFFAFFSALCSLPLAIAYWQEIQAEHFVLLASIALLFCINIITISKAYQYTELTIIMPFAFFHLIFASILAYFIFDNIITDTTIIGAAIIICSTSYISYRERKVHKQFMARKIGETILENQETS